MKNILLLGVSTALVTGIMIGTQSTLSSRLGGMIESFRTGLLMNVFGGSIALIILGGTYVFSVKWESKVTPTAIWMLLAAGLLGVGIIMGVSFSLPKIGVTAGIATLILGQLLVSIIVDTTGWGGAEPIPLSISRIAGLFVMGLAVYLLLPRG